MACAPLAADVEQRPRAVAAHLQYRVHDQVHGELGAAEGHAEGVDQERHVVGDREHQRMRGLEAVALQSAGLKTRTSERPGGRRVPKAQVRQRRARQLPRRARGEVLLRRRRGSRCAGSAALSSLAAAAARPRRARCARSARRARRECCAAAGYLQRQLARACRSSWRKPRRCRVRVAHLMQSDAAADRSLCGRAIIHAASDRPLRRLRAPRGDLRSRRPARAAWLIMIARATMSCTA